MAQMSPEEFIEALESVTESLRNNKAANQQQAEQLLKSIGIDKTRADEVLKSSQKFGTSSLNMAKGMAAGADSAKTMASSLDTVVTGLELLLSLIPGYRLLKIGIMLTTKALAGLTKAATEQAQAEFKAYQQLNQIGAAGAEGLRGVFDTVQKFGYNVNELDKMVALVAANSESLAEFGGLASQGTTAFADAMNQLTHGTTGAELGALGKNLEDINGAGAAYIRMQTLLGRTQQQVGSDLAGKTKQYIMDLDRLQRLTGTSADALEKQQQAALLDSAYASYIDQLKSSGEAGEAQANKINDILSTLTPEMQALARRGIGGDVGAAQQLNFIAPSLIKNLRDSSSTFEGTVDSVNRDLINFKQKYGQAYQYNAEGMNEFGTKFVNLTENIAKTSNIRQRIEEVGIEQARAGLQSDVKNMATSEVLNRQNTASLQEMLQKGVGPATTALEKLAEVTNAVTSRLPGSKNVTTGAGAANVTSGVQIIGSAEARTKAENYYGKKMSDAEFSALVKATHAEAGAGKQANQQEQAMIMASILNRARTDAGGIIGALTAKNQFQSVTGTAADGHRPSKNYLEGPTGNRLKSIEGSAELLEKISKEQKNFTAADAKAYGRGTNIGYRNKMLADGGQIIGGSVFQTGMPSGPNDKEDTKTASTVSGPNSKWNDKTADIKPASTLPPSADRDQARAAAQNTQSEDIIASFTERLAEQTRLQREANDIARGIKRGVT